jgi:phosphate transport system substrate-binding protein
MPARPSAPSRRRLLALAGRSAALAVLAPMLAGRHAAATEPQTVRIGGTGLGLAVMRRLGDAFERAQPGGKVVVMPSLGSSGGIKALYAGALDIALSVRPLKDEERVQGGIPQLLARTPFVLATRRDTSVAGMSGGDLVRIYVGETTSWPDGMPIRLILRPAPDAANGLLQTISAEMAHAVEIAQHRPGLVMAGSDQENADMLEALPGSFGTTSLGQIITEERKLKPLALDGTIPTLEAVKGGSYPHTYPLYSVVRPAHASMPAAFLAFLDTPEAQTILAAAGFLPAEAAERRA